MIKISSLKFFSNAQRKLLNVYECVNVFLVCKAIIDAQNKNSPSFILAGTRGLTEESSIINNEFTQREWKPNCNTYIFYIVVLPHYKRFYL